MTITLWHCEHTAWARFAQFHYTPDTDRCRVCRCYLALVDGKCVGFVAAMHSGYGCWRAHKTVVTLPKDHPGYFPLWAAVADAQAELHLKKGHRFTVVAPADHAAYRDASPLWKVTVRDARQRKKGNRSHEYVGLIKPAIADAGRVEPSQKTIQNCQKRGLTLGACGDSVNLFSKSGTLLATGYARIVFGERGAYLEIPEVQIVTANLKYINTAVHRYFKEFRSTDDSNVMVYLQRRVVAYADYRVGMWYISPDDLNTKDGAVIRPAESAPTLDPTPDSKPDPDLIERIADSRLYNENCYDAMTRGVDASTLIKGLTRDRRNSDEMKAILKAGGAEYQGKKIMGSANDPYIQRWTRQEVKDAITWCGAHIETMYSEEAKARLAIELAEAGGPS